MFFSLILKELKTNYCR